MRLIRVRREEVLLRLALILLGLEAALPTPALVVERGCVALLVEVRVDRGLRRIAVPHDRLNVINDLTGAKHQIRRVIGDELTRRVSDSILLILAPHPVAGGDCTDHGL